MKHWPTFLLVLIMFSCTDKHPLTIQERYEISYRNFIPIDGSKAPNYWNTWDAQNFASDTTVTMEAANGNIDYSKLANQLNEKNIFGSKEWSSYFPKVTKDLYILFDLGWNTDSNSKIEKDIWQLGGFDLAKDKFPSCTGTSVERLTKLNELCKGNGWKGAGLRLAAHPAVAAYSVDYQLEQIRRYYYEKLLMCSAAGIEYLKIDDGLYSGNDEFRKMITSVAKETAPNLIIEHTQDIAPINDYGSPNDTIIFYETGTFKDWGNGFLLENSLNTIRFSDAFSVHDVTKQLSTATTLERVSQILAQFTTPPVTKGIINCGDEVYLAAGLGCSIGISRHALFIEVPDFVYDPFLTRNRIDEVFRAVRWQRLAEPFGAGQSTVYVDAKRLTDSWIFKKGDSWANWLTGDTITQKAPARISRGMELPKVESLDEPSYVTCSKYPSGAIALATLPRVSSDSGLYYPLVDITVEAINWDKPIAIFGELKSLTINFEKLPRNFIVWGQDLASNSAIEITDLIEVKENSIKLDGELTKEIGLLAATPGDKSYPGMMLVIKK